jgi:hypothetical protein
MNAIIAIPGPIYSGDAFTVRLAFWTDTTNTVALDMTGLQVGLTIKENLNDADAAADFEQDLAGDTTGKFNFAVAGLETANYWVDAKMWSGGQRSSVIAPQQFSVLQSITARAEPSV